MSIKTTLPTSTLYSTTDSHTTIIADDHVIRVIYETQFNIWTN